LGLVGEARVRNPVNKFPGALIEEVRWPNSSKTLALGPANREKGQQLHQPDRAKQHGSILLSRIWGNSN